MVEGADCSQVMETIRARVKIQMHHDKSEAAVWAPEAPGIQMREPSTLHSS